MFELALFGAIWLIPLLLAMPAKRLRGAIRWRWLIIIALTSWLGFVAFSLIADRYPRKR